MSKNRFKVVPAVYLLLEDAGNRILLMERTGTGYRDGEYGLCMGHVELDEDPIQAVIREAREELGIVIALNDVHFVHCLHRNKHDGADNYIDLFFLVSRWNGEIKNEEPGKCGELQWADISTLPSNTIDYIKDVLLNVRDGIVYSQLRGAK